MTKFKCLHCWRQIEITEGAVALLRELPKADQERRESLPCSCPRQPTALVQLCYLPRPAPPSNGLVFDKFQRVGVACAQR